MSETVAYLRVPNVSRGDEAVLVRFLDLHSTEHEHTFRSGDEDVRYWKQHWTVSTAQGQRVLTAGPQLNAMVEDHRDILGSTAFLFTVFRLCRKGFGPNTTYHLTPTDLLEPA